ncbi:MAG: ribonuclease H-like domain-containing protein [Saprospiraceae bacterium]
MIIQKKILRNILFLDIETASNVPSFDDLDDVLKLLWTKKSKKFLTDKSIEITEEMASVFYDQKAAIFAEFGRVVCISVGYLANKRNETPKLRLKSFAGEERLLLSAFSELLNAHYDNPETDYISGHNIKEFDIPFLCRRMVIHGLSLPRLLHVSGKKPWQVTYLLDTLVMWRFGDYKSYSSLLLLASVLGILSPKDDIDGSQVSNVFWKENGIERIITYCEKDVVTVVQIIMKFSGMDIINDDEIEIIPMYLGSSEEE